jgi:hypothetical protein
VNSDWKFLDPDFRARLSDEFLSHSAAEIEYQQRVLGRNLSEVERIAMMRRVRHEAQDEQE